MKLIHMLHLRSAKAHKALHLGESWTHAVYCGVLFVEGHGAYASVGGILGAFVVVNLLVGGE